MFLIPLLQADLVNRTFLLGTIRTLSFGGDIGVSQLAPHDLRRSCARLCRATGGELEQIQFLLGHVSVQTTERYLDCTQRIASAVNDRIGIEPKA
jgi:site-specific recombinase XerD